MLEDRTNPTPVITIVKGADAFEGVSNGSFILSRTDDPNHPISQSLSVNVALQASSTATPGQDYQFLTSYVNFAAGSATATVTVNVMGSPYNDSYVENDETVILNIAGPGQNYTVGSPSSATVYIVDNDTNAHDYYWTGAVDDSWSTAANWTLDPVNKTPASDAPHGLRDNVYFDGGVSNADSTGGGGYSGYKSLHMIHDYSGVLTLGSDEFQTFEQTTGRIDQPSTATILVVTQSFTWKGGVLNGSNYLANVLITGSTTTALFAPEGGGSMTLGSSITLDNGATGTEDSGTIDTNKDGIQFITSGGSNFSVVPSVINGVASAVIGSTFFPPKGIAGPGTSWTYYPGVWRLHGPMANLGTVTVKSGAQLVTDGDPETEEGYVQTNSNAATYLQGESYLISFQNVIIQGGTLATVWEDSVSSGSATIIAENIQVSGGDIYVCMQSGSHIHFGELLVDGNVDWSGGTFHPYVYSGGTANDDWRQINDNFNGIFTINGGTVAPIYLDSDYGTSSSPNSGDWWEVLKSSMYFVNNSTPSVDNPTLWTLAPENASPPSFWKLIAQ